MAEQIGNGSTEGEILGRSGGKLGFYGTTPVAKQTVVTTALTTTPSNSALATRINDIQDALKAYGII